MPPTLQIATAADLAILLEMKDRFQIFFQEAYDKDLTSQAFQALLNDPTLGHVWLIQLNDQTVGYLAFTLGYSIEFGGRTAFVDELFIEEGYRQQGIGREVLALVDQFGKQAGLQVLFLEVAKDNLPAQALYQKMGYRERKYYLLAKLLNE